MKKILIINVMALYSYGGRAVIKGAINSLRENIPDAQLTFMSSHYNQESKIYEKWNYKNVELIEHIWYKETKSFPLTMFLSTVCGISVSLKFTIYKIFHKIIPIENRYKQYDLIIDLSTDGLNDHYGFFMPIFFMLNILLAKIVEKPIVVCAGSIGKFENNITKSLARFVLNKVDLITVREEISYEYLQTLGINKPKIYLTADNAFLMKPAALQRILEILKIENINSHDKPIIGISPSQLIHQYAFSGIDNKKKKYLEYKNIMTKSIEYLIESISCQVILIPHSAAKSDKLSIEDDMATSNEIFEAVTYRDKTKLLRGEYNEDELKGIIGLCDMFIGCRMHSTIASTSMGVPTIAVVYGHKSHGIIGKMMGQENCIIEIGKYNPYDLLSELKLKIDYVWKNRFYIMGELKEKTKIAENKALTNGKYIKELLDSLQ